MHIEFTSDTRLIEFRPDTKSERILLEDFPAFIRPRGMGRFFIPPSISVLKNIVGRLKKVYHNQISCSKEIAEMMGTKIKLKELPDSFQYITSPFNHQDISLRFMYTFGSGGLLLDPGLGKTKVVLDLIKLMGFEKSFVVAPKALLFVWEDEAEIHQPSLKVHVLESTSWDDQLDTARKAAIKWEMALEDSSLSDAELKKVKAKYNAAKRKLITIPEKKAEDLRKANEADVVVVNYDKLSSNYKYIQRNFKFDFIAVDEALIKSHTSKRTEAVTKIGMQIPNRCIMSGTLVNNSPMDCFAPIRFLQPALTGMSYSRFETYYGHIIKIKKSGRKFLAGVSKANVEEIRGILDACCIVMDKDKWLNLPKKKFITHYVPLSSDQYNLQQDLLANSITSFQGVEVDASSPLTVMSKMYQISNGFIYHYPDKADDYDMYALLDSVDAYEDSGFDDMFDDMMADIDSDSSSRVSSTTSGRSLEGDHVVSAKVGKAKVLSHPAKATREILRILNDSGLTPKAEYLRDLLVNNDELRSRKMLIWYNLSQELPDIIDSLSHVGFHPDEISVVKGGTKNTGDIVRTFNRNPNKRILICQAQAVNYGITVLGADPESLEKDGVNVLPNLSTEVYTHIFYSIGFSLERFLQQQDRSHRIGLKKPPEYHIILADCEFERAIMDALNNKTDIRESILIDLYHRLSSML